MAQILKEHKVESKEFLAKELFNERKFDKAFPLTLEADQNDPQIVYNLGFMYDFGKGAKCDRKKGHCWSEKRMKWVADTQTKSCAG